jgi:phosphoinositide-3-kinase regulatory subunit 4
VRTLALGCVVRVMASLPQLPPADAKVYHDYLLPSLSLLPNDPEESVRVAYAQAIADLAAAAHAQLLTMQYGHAGLTAQGQQQQQQQPGQAASSEGGAGAAAAAPAAEIDAAGIAPAGGEAAGNVSGQQQSQPVVRYDVEMAAVRACVERVVLELVTGLRSSPDIKRGLLSHAHQLGLFFGRREIIDQLLPLLITCLNDQYEWRLRGSFFGAIAAVGPHTGHLDAFLLPCLEQVRMCVCGVCRLGCPVASRVLLVTTHTPCRRHGPLNTPHQQALQDSEPAVVCDAVRCLADVCAHLPKRSLLKAAKQVAPLLQHRAPAVRHAAVAFIAAVARALAPADVYTQLAVMVASQLQQQPLLLSGAGCHTLEQRAVGV